MKHLFSIVFAVFTLTNANAYLQMADSTIMPANRVSSEKLADLVRFETISATDSAGFRYGEFKRLHTYLADAFPLVHSHLKLEVINGYCLLYTWKGLDSGLKPMLFNAHMDVVPVEANTSDEWQQEPFAGTVKDGFVWGRGTMDDKSRIVAILQAVEQLLEKGYTPDRTLYLAFGHDEEVGGFEGAAMISQHLQQQGVALEAVFDEGLSIVEGVVPGINEPLALVGTSEKGNLSLLLTVHGEGGHSSVPPDDTPINILSRAIQVLHDNPFEPRMTATTRETLELLSTKMQGKYKFALRHYGLFKGKILKKLAKDRVTDALIRTTLVPTIISSGERHNVLPRHATAIVNVRILSGETDETVLQHVRKTINDDRVKIEQYGVYTPPSPITQTDTWIYEALKSTILIYFKDVMVVPALFPAATDSRHYTNLTSNIFRFSPLVVNRESALLVHNANERLSVEVLENCVVFYKSLIQNICGKQAQSP